MIILNEDPWNKKLLHKPLQQVAKSSCWRNTT